MKDGDAGSIRGMGAAAVVPKDGCRERPFKFRGFLGEGEVIGLKTGFTSEGFDAMTDVVSAGFPMVPNVVAG
jgi:hypothetical protein